MTGLLTTCRQVVEQHAPEGVWRPSSASLFEQFGESMEAIAEVSRTLNQARGGIRRIGGRARERLYDRDARHGGRPQARRSSSARSAAPTW